MKKSTFLKESFEKVNRLVQEIDQFLSPGRILTLGVVSGGLMILAYMLFCFDIYRDVACYAYYAREWGRGNWMSAPISSLPPLNIFLGGCLARPGLEAYSAIVLLAGLFYLMTVFPLFGILKRFVPGKMAAYGCLLYLLAPKVIRSAGMGLLEMTRDFFLVLSLYLLFKIKDAPRKWLPAACFGGALGLLSLSRGESIVFALLLLVFLPFVLLYRVNINTAYFFRAPVVSTAIAAFVFLLAVSPRLAENYRNTGYPVLDARSIDIVSKVPGISSLFQDRRKELWEEQVIEAVITEEAYKSFGIVEKLSKIRQDLIRGAYEVYLFFAVIGMILLLRRRSWRYEYTIFLLVILLILPAYFATISAYRYYLFTIPLLMVFTVIGMNWALERLERIRLKGTALLFFAGVLALQAVNGMEMVFKKPDEYRFGMWLRENRKPLPGEGGSSRLTIHAYDLPEAVYWADGRRRYEFSQPMAPLSQVTGFDLLIIHREETNDAAMVRAREDLREIEHPFSDEYLLFEPSKARGD